MRTGRDMADELRAAAASYGHADEAGEDVLARVAYDLLGDPGAAGDTWSDVAAAGVAGLADARPAELAGRLGGHRTRVVDQPLDDLRPIVQ